LLDSDTNKEPLEWFNEAFREAGGIGKLTRKSLRAVFESYDEFGISDDALDAMIQIAGDGNLEQALTGDLGQFNLEWKNQYATNLEKVLRLEPNLVPEQSFDAENAPKNMKDTSLLRQKVTAPFVDFIAENYRRSSFVMLLWGAGILTYIAYIFGVTDKKSQDYWAEVKCDDKLSESGCAIVKGIVTWLVSSPGLRGSIFFIYFFLSNCVFLFSSFRSLLVGHHGPAGTSNSLRDSSLCLIPKTNCSLFLPSSTSPLLALRLLCSEVSATVFSLRSIKCGLESDC